MSKGICSFGLFCEDDQDRDQQKLIKGKIKGKSANPDIPGKWSLKQCMCTRVCVCGECVCVSDKIIKLTCGPLHRK